MKTLNARTGFMAALLGTILSGASASAYQQTNLVSDLPGVALNQDVNLQNPWGVSYAPTGPFWVSDNGTGLTTLYTAGGTTVPLVVTIPPAGGGTPPSAPTGQVFNGTGAFALPGGSPALFLFDSENGTVSGWNSGTNAITMVDNSASGAVYKGLALGQVGASNFLYAANFNAGTIDVFNNTFQPTALTGSFLDPNLPAGYAPFNVENLGGSLFVTYALQDADKGDDVSGAGHGFVDVYSTSGVLQKRLISGGVLNSPWGLALAPGSFGPLANALLVGNFGDGTIHAFDPTTGAALGVVEDGEGHPITIQGLWALKFGGGGASNGPLSTLFFTAGIPGPDGQIEDHGLFGSIAAVPEPGTALLLGAGFLGLAIGRRQRA